ncbi:MAG: LPD7 domain-containing protein [Candidatus Saccharibacteria bacterium]|nr:LPD7 domain-containing protein [Candidatus Saccharibacteria bacterium]
MSEENIIEPGSANTNQLATAEAIAKPIQNTRRQDGSAGERASRDFLNFKVLLEKKQSIEALLNTSEIQNSNQARIQVEVQNHQQALAIASAAAEIHQNMLEVKAYRDEIKREHDKQFEKVSKDEFINTFKIKYLLEEDEVESHNKSIEQRDLELAALREDRIAKISEAAHTPAFPAVETIEKIIDALDISTKAVNQTFGDEKQSVKKVTDGISETIIPDSIKRKYVVIDNKYYESGKDAKLAFIDNTTHIKAPDREPLDHHVRSMVEIAEAREWPSIKVKGTKEFRSSVWLEASLRGIKVEGYTPSPVEKAQLETLLKKQSKAEEENSISKGQAYKQSASATNNAPSFKTDLNTQDQLALARKEDQKTFARESSPKEETPSTSKIQAIRSFSGTVIEHGDAPYEFQKDNSANYYAKLQTPTGEQVIWGKDIKRAIEVSNTTVGENIKLLDIGKQPVTVTENVKDESGKVIGTKLVDKHRNTWVVESEKTRQAEDNKPELSRKEKLLQVFDRYPNLIEAALKHPEYDELKHSAAAYEITRKSIESLDKKSQETVLNRFKEILRNDIESDNKGVVVNIREPLTNVQGQDKKNVKARSSSTEKQLRPQKNKEYAQ